MLKVRKLNKSYGELVVIKDLDFEVDSRIQVFVGVNGCGKSTMLKIIAGLVEEDSGDIWLNDRNIAGLSPEDRKIGYVPQQPSLFPHLNVEENIRYGVKNQRSSVRLTDELIELIGLQGLLAKKPRELSGGYQSRVSLARAVVSNPDIMLLDEPLSSLDTAVKEKVLPSFRETLSQLNVPVLYVTHDPWEAEQISNSFSVFAERKLIQVETADEAFRLLRADYRSVS